MSPSHQSWFEQAVNARKKELEEKVELEARRRLFGTPAAIDVRAAALKSVEKAPRTDTYLVQLGPNISVREYPSGTFIRQVAVLAKTYLHGKPRYRSELTIHVKKYVDAKKHGNISATLHQLMNDGVLTKAATA